MARLKRAQSRQRQGLIQKQNLNAPGGTAEQSAINYDQTADAGMVGFGPDRRRRPWWFGLGHNLIGAKVPMHDIVDARWQDVGIKRMDVKTNPKGNS